MGPILEKRTSLAMIGIVRFLRDALRNRSHRKRIIKLMWEKKPHEALDIIYKIKILAPIEAVRMALIEGDLLYSVGRNEEAIASYKKVFDFTDATKIYSKYDKAYLKCYASVLGSELAKKMGQKPDDLFHVDYEAVPLSKVKRNLKRHYRLVTHPDWDKS